MDKKIILIFLFLPLLISSCEKNQPGKEFDCHMGTNYNVTDDLSFIITSLNDSRCPKDKKCGVAGTVYLNYRVNLTGNIFDTVLYLNPTEQPPNAQFGGYDFGVYKVEPISAGTTSDKNITITMVISRL